MDMVRAFSFCLLVMSCSHVAAFWCEKQEFQLADYKDYEIIRGLVISHNNVDLLSDYFTRNLCIRNSCDELDIDFLAEAEDIYSTATMVVVLDSYGGESRRGDTLVIEQGSPIDHQVGEEYLFTIRPLTNVQLIDNTATKSLMQAKTLNMYDYDPCALVPITVDIKDELYFFNQSPQTILKLLEPQKNPHISDIDKRPVRMRIRLVCTELDCLE